MKVLIRGKPFFAFKIFLISLFIMFSSTAYAEYYVVSPGYYECFSGCCDCYSPCGTCYMHFSSPHRYNDKGSGQVEEYAWISYP